MTEDQEVNDEEIDDREGRPFGVIVTNICVDGSHGHYIADMLIDGEPRSFKFTMRDEHSLSPDDAHYETFQYAQGSARRVGPMR